jgi:hypothetical protein
MLLLVSKSLNHVYKLRLVYPFTNFTHIEEGNLCQKVHGILWQSKNSMPIYNSYNTSTKWCCNWNDEYNFNG